MAKTTYGIRHLAAGWEASYDYSQANGPLLLSQDGVPFMKGFINAFDGRSMLVIKSRTFRKTGCAVNDTEARFNATGGTGFRQITRYAANLARVQTDVLIKRDTEIKSRLQLGAFELPGSWQRLLVIRQDGTSEWLTLSAGSVLNFAIPFPLVMVFERADGFRFEVSLSFDLWRWNSGIDGTSQSIVITVEADGLVFDRSIVRNSNEEPYLPAARDYRFCHQFAWSTHLEQPAAGSTNAHEVDLRTLSYSDGARNSDGVICWESKNTIACGKRIIRQLAETGDRGTLHFTGGLTPSVCTNGSHVDRPRKTTLHWDLNSVICFAIWTRQTLGPGWHISADIDGIWAELPSLKHLFGMNGFGKDLDEEEDLNL